jgi:DnaJ-class molecular chaperone
MTPNTTICPYCKGNGFKYLTLNPIITEPCSECKMTGEQVFTDYNSINFIGVSNDNKSEY